jgi:hypothetical protein
LGTELDREERIIRAFARKKKMRYRLIIATGIVLIISIIVKAKQLTIGSLSASNLALTLLGAVVLILVYAYFDWRCPACNKYFGRTGNPGQCPHCGVKLQKD